MKKVNLIGFLASLILVGQAAGGWPPSNIQIVPEHPTSCDIVVITISGWWGSSCVPVGSTISVMDSNIYFDVSAHPPGVCLTVMTPWSRTRSVGPLLPGTYTVYARIVGDPFIRGEYTKIAQFVVSDKQFVLSTKLLTVPEGNTASFTVALMMDPCNTVEVTVAPQSGDPDITVESGGTLFFDPSNYSTPQTVTLAAAEDEDYLNGQVVIQISAMGYLTDEVIAVEGDNDIPSVLYVDADANDNNDGRSWMDAFTDLQEALIIAEQYSEIKEIHVAQGIYKPAGPSGYRYAVFQLINGLSIKGGYAGFGEPDPDARNISSYKTILSGDLNGNDGPNFINRGDNSFNVVVGSGADSTSVLDGFTITAGDGAVGGGGMICYDGDPTIKNCIFRGNRANYGGGIRCYNSNLTVTNCIFERNGSPGDRIDDGGAIYIQGNSISTLTNCTFVDNWTVETGGGLCCNYPSIAKITNCIFWHNLDGGGMDESAQIYGENLVINYSCIQGWTGVLGGSGNFGANPLFTDPNNGDYHLLPDSPCIDTGDPNYILEPNVTDLDGLPRLIGPRVDIGAYEFNHEPVANAGPDQTAYAWIDGKAKVILDGSDSNDADDDTLTYKWTWTIDSSNYEANGVSPTIELPVSVHTIQLMVNDGLVDSAPDDVNITVVAPLEGNLKITPQTINRKSNQPHILAFIELDGIAKSAINAAELLTLYPGGIKATRQWLFTSKDRHGKPQTTIFAFFDKDALMTAVPTNGDKELKVAGKLKSGQYFYGCDTVKIISLKWQWP